ncbi:hypothetical protein K040078D81_03680 [Blautia hominis]|uniref:Uncharacterized protein n=1 Tax=Blautia hominis TaxID=2025493 RepID=A0ABQ0B471_9FIRM
MVMTTAVMKVTDRAAGKTPRKNNLRETLKERVCMNGCTSFCCLQKNMGFLRAAVSGWDALEE